MTYQKIGEILLKYSGKIIYSIIILVVGVVLLKFSNKMFERWKNREKAV